MSNVPVPRFTVTRPLDLPEPYGAPLPRAEALKLAVLGLRALDALEARNEADRQRMERSYGKKRTREVEDLFLRDDSLHPLHVLKFEGPFQVIGTCRHRIGYIALTPHPELEGMIVFFAPKICSKKNRKGGARDLRNHDRTKAVTSPQVMMGLATDVPDSNVEPSSSGPWGAPVGRRWTITCPVGGCGATSRVLNVTRLRLFLQAIVDGDGIAPLAGRSIGIG
jgi:hypothetical protein